MATFVFHSKYSFVQNGKRRDFNPGDKISEKVYQNLTAMGKTKCEPARQRSRKNPNVATEGRKPIEAKSHYRWISTYLELLPQFVELNEGELTVEQVWYSEELAALNEYQPVLAQTDTTKRKIISRRGKELCAKFATLGRPVAFDRTAYHDAVAVAFGGKNTDEYENGTAALSGIELDAFREIARNEVRELTRTVYPSVANRVA